MPMVALCNIWSFSFEFEFDSLSDESHQDTRDTRTSDIGGNGNIANVFISDYEEIEATEIGLHGYSYYGITNLVNQTLERRIHCHGVLVQVQMNLEVPN